MTLQELLEHAHLDALGQLDEKEQAAFEAAFTVAPPAVQAQIRREQARFANMDHLLPQVEPPAYLRERVLNAVSAAMIAEGAGTDLNLAPAKRVHTAWRASAIGLVTAVVVLGVAFVNVYTANQRMTHHFEDDAANSAFLQRFERTYMGDVLYSATSQRVLMTAAQGFSGKAVIWVDEKWNDSKMFCELPGLQGESYRLVVVDDNGAIERTITEIAADGVHKSITLPKLTSGMRVALVSARINEPATGGKFLMEGVVA
ncbi:MAG TPA: hypothetical protein VD997_03290 [Phycisphaerales bacterium]|nr:hypothetical protein [Phycisphaerales bacterium]